MRNVERARLEARAALGVSPGEIVAWWAGLDLLALAIWILTRAR